MFPKSGQVAAFLDVKECTLAEWRKKGWIPYIRMGGHPVTGAGGSVRYRRRDVIACMERRVVDHGGELNVLPGDSLGDLEGVA